MTLLEGINQDLKIINSINIPVGLMDQIGTPLKAVASDLYQIKAALEAAVKKESEAQQETVQPETDDEPVIELVPEPQVEEPGVVIE